MIFTGRHRKTRKSENGVITARPCAQVAGASKGFHRLGLAEARDGIFYVPDSHTMTQPAPLVVMLHGAGGNAHDAIQRFRRLADEKRVVLLAPDARSEAWDLLDGGFGSDVDFIDHALARVFERCAIDARHVAIEGFSDGGSYALSLGLRNAELFTHVIAFSPGFMTVPTSSGRPRIFISHGAADLVLPAVRCSHRIVGRLEREGYDVTFREFSGGHLVPEEIAVEAMNWFLAETA